MKKLFIIVCATLCLTLCGCSKEVTPTSVTKDFVEGMRNEIKTNYLEYFGGVTETEDSFSKEFEEKLANSIAGFDYSINNETIDGDNATVNVTFKTYDYGLFIKTFLGEYIQKAFTLALGGGTEEDVEKIANELAEEKFEEMTKEGKKSELSMDFKLNKVDGSWVLDEEANKDSLANAITGGLYSAVESIQDQYSNLFN